MSTRGNLQSTVLNNRLSVSLLLLGMLGSWVISLGFPEATTPAVLRVLPDLSFEHSISLGITLLAHLCIGFMLMPMNGVIRVIRNKISLQCFFYFLWVACFRMLHPFSADLMLTCLMLISIGIYTISSQRRSSSPYVYHALFFFGLAACLYPPLFLLLPLYVVGAMLLHINSWRNVLAGFFGLAFGYVIFVVYTCLCTSYDLFQAIELPFLPLREIILTLPNALPHSIPSLGFIYIVLLTIFTIVYYSIARPKLMAVVRAHLTFLIFAQICLSLFLLLRPEMCYTLLPLCFVCLSFTLGHYYSTVHTRISRLVFMGTLFLPPILLVISLIWADL